MMLIIMTLLGCNKEQKVNLREAFEKGKLLDSAQELSVNDFFSNMDT